MCDTRSPARFPTTLWSRVIRAGDPTDREGQAALERYARTTGIRSMPLSDERRSTRMKRRTSFKDFSPT